jgi:hypothetical protein
MDGAAKFVRGDAIAGLIITGINILGGLLIGLLRHKMGFADALISYTTLTIGDGLVAQIPSLLITIGSGLLVTKVRSNETMGQELARAAFYHVGRKATDKALRTAARMLGLASEDDLLARLGSAELTARKVIEADVDLELLSEIAERRVVVVGFGRVRGLDAALEKPAGKEAFSALVAYLALAALASTGHLHQSFARAYRLGHHLRAASAGHAVAAAVGWSDLTAAVRGAERHRSDGAVSLEEFMLQLHREKRRCERSQGSHPCTGRSGMLPTPNVSSTTPRTPRAWMSPYASRGSQPGTMGTRMTWGSSLKRGR